MSRVLVVDNDNLVADVCRIALNRIGHQVKCTNSGDKAIGFVKEEKFELVIVNYYLEGMSGIEMFHVMKQEDPQLRGILVIDTTNSETVIQALNCGFTRICKLPLDEKVITDTVSQLLKIAKLRDDVTRLNTLVPLYKLTQRFLSADDEAELYEELIATIATEIGVPCISVMMFDDKCGALKVVAYRGLKTEHVESLEVRPGELISGKVFQSKRPIILNRTTQHFSPYIKLLKRKELQAAISFPIVSKSQIVGVLNVSETEDSAHFHEADLELLAIICDQAMMALENIRANREREEQTKVRTLLEQYVSSEVSKILLETRKDILEVGEIMDLTIFFADISNFTLLVQQLSPEVLRRFLNIFFEILTETVFKYNGMLDKFLGDGALAVFGAPVRIQKPSYAAVKMGRELMYRFRELRERHMAEYPVFQEIGLNVGISRGAVFLGNIGSAQRVDYTVIGTDVNIAQRLASVPASGKVLLTSRVAEDLQGEFDLDSGQEMFLRGLENSVKVYSLKEFEDEV